ncbi:hypothetical protein ACTA71_011576 [Dictyostelium dimigraforme]
MINNNNNNINNINEIINNNNNYVNNDFKNNINNNNNIFYSGIKNVQIPIYIQKKIYKYLIIMELNKSDHDSYEINSRIIRKFSLLSWEWFNFISSKIYHTLIIKDYERLEPLITSDNNNQFLLMKPETVKYLKLVNLSRMNIDKVNETLKSLVNLKWITSEHNNSAFPKIKFNNFRINSMMLSRHEGVIFSNYVKRVDNLHIESKTPSKNIIDAFKTAKIYGLTLNLKQNYTQYNINNFPWKELYHYSEIRKEDKANNSATHSGGDDDDDERIIETIPTENRLQWCKDVNFVILNVKMLNEFLKSTPRLRDLTFGICFANLVHKIYKRYSSSYDEYEPKPCNCSNSFERVDHYDLFPIYWDEICTLLSNHKYLTKLTIIDRCLNDKTSTIKYDSIEEVYPPPPPPPFTTRLNITLEQNQHFLQSFVNFISHNKSIKTLEIKAYDFLDIDTLSILNHSNTTIDTYRFSFQKSSNENYYSQTLEKVKEYFQSPNNAIKSFEIMKNISNYEGTLFKYNRDRPELNIKNY